jgi:alanyl-tRNA synthetase
MQNLGMQEPFIFRVVPAVTAVLGDAFPEMRARAEHVQTVVEAEEKAFAVTLSKGVTLFEEVAAAVGRKGTKSVPGDTAYRLYATFGFPRDLVDLMARERGLSVDDAAWKAAEEQHRAASRGGGGGKYLVDPDELRDVPPTETGCYAAGEKHDGCSLRVRPLKLIDGTRLVLDRTPFYAEAGGQVGDKGLVEAPGFRFEVDDTQKMGKVVVHVGRLAAGSAQALPAEASAVVDRARRLDVMANHTATHLLHWALRKILGESATQQGSLVAPDRLRFDFTHGRALTLEEIEQIEDLVNERIVEDIPLWTTVEDLAAAKERGVTALFGEKYDDRVRVVDIGGFSQELCGGTHCRATGQIGAFAITGESAVQAGIRRIEAVTRRKALERLQQQRRILRETAALLKASEAELPKRVAQLQKDVKEVRKGGHGGDDVAALGRELLERAVAAPKGRVIVARVDVAPDQLAALADAVRNKGAGVAGLIAAADGDRVALVAFAARDLVERKAVHAGDLVKAVAPVVGGGGGGRPDLAQAGGKDAARLDEALALGRSLLEKALA